MYRGANAHQHIKPARGVTTAIGIAPQGKAAGFNCADVHNVGFEYTCIIIIFKYELNKIQLTV